MKSLFWRVLFYFFIACCGYPSSTNIDEMPARPATIFKTSTRLEKQSRDAVVQVSSISGTGMQIGTGTVFKYKKSLIVITSAHVLSNVSDSVTVSNKRIETNADIVYYDLLNDLAVLKLPSDLNIESIPFKIAGPKDMSIGSDLVYTGFPNNSSMLTIRGYIAGQLEDGLIIMKSYAWSGASGSSVFDKSGKLVGILMAVDVGRGLYGEPNIIQDVVFLVPAWKLNLDLLSANL